MQGLVCGGLDGELHPLPSCRWIRRLAGSGRAPGRWTMAPPPAQTAGRMRQVRRRRQGSVPWIARRLLLLLWGGCQHSHCALACLHYPLSRRAPADFKSLHFPPPSGSDKPGLNDFVRRRRWVRRRRREGRSQAPGKLLGAAAALGHFVAGQGSGDQQVVKQRQVLGRAAPGEALPLPLGWNAPGRQLQLRPVLPVNGAAPEEPQPAQPAAAEAAKGAQQEEQEADKEGPQLRAAHDWSYGTSDGRATVKLDGLDEGITRLICCPALHTTGARRRQAGPAAPLAQPSPAHGHLPPSRRPSCCSAAVPCYRAAVGSSSSELEVCDLWFSLAVEADILGGKQAKPMTGGWVAACAPGYSGEGWCWCARCARIPALCPPLPSLPRALRLPPLAPSPADWRIVVAAPLRLTNQLPVAGSLLVWEQQPGTARELVGRQTVQVASGATVPIHTGTAPAGTRLGAYACSQPLLPDSSSSPCRMLPPAPPCSRHAAGGVIHVLPRRLRVGGAAAHRAERGACRCTQQVWLPVTASVQWQRCAGRPLLAAAYCPALLPLRLPTLPPQAAAGSGSSCPTASACRAPLRLSQWKSSFIAPLSLGPGCSTPRCAAALLGPGAWPCAAGRCSIAPLRRGSPCLPNWCCKESNHLWNAPFAGGAGPGGGGGHGRAPDRCGAGSC